MQLVTAEKLREAIWPDPQARPSIRWVRQHQLKLPHVRIGRRIWFDVQSVERAIAEGKFQSTK
jgi:hypothetical protein